ncbi:MAG: tyrosine-type recombinase/integrase, partial [Polyangiaceae bacterium]
VDAFTRQRTDAFVCAVHARGNDKQPCNRRQPCGEGAHPHTVKKELNCLRGVLHLARRRGEYTLDPGQVLPKWKAHYEPRTTVHTLDEAWRVLRAIDDVERRGCIAYAYGTGARLTELVRARPREHVRSTAGEVFIDGTKTKRARRTIPITPVMKPFIEVALKGLPEGQDQFRPWTNLRRDLLAACRRAGVPAVSMNDLRRSYCSWHLEAGLPADLVARYLGHASTEMVARIYGRPSDDALKTLTEKHFSGATPRAASPTPATGDAGGKVIPFTNAKRRKHERDAQG